MKTTPPIIDRERPLYFDGNLHVIFGIAIMAVFGVSSITPVFPAVVDAFGIAPEDVGLLVTYYALPGIFFMPVIGVLADRFGRKQVLVPALILFAVAGTSCAFARDFQTLLVLRFLQGMGGSSLGSLSATLIGDLYQEKQRTEAMGYKASAISLGSAVLPSLGGAIAVFGWYAPFALPILALGVAGAVLFKLELPARGTQGPFLKYAGDALAGMKSRRVVGLYLATLLSFVVLYGSYMTFIPLLLADRFGSSALAIGPVMTVGSLTTALTASRLGWMNRLVAPERLLVSAFALYAVSLLLISSSPGPWWILLPVGLFGVAQGLNYPVVLLLLANQAPPLHRAIFMSTNGVVIRIGQATGPLIMGMVFAQGGMNMVFYTGVGICVTVFLGLPLLIGKGESRARK